jgi:hypothetical protein
MNLRNKKGRGKWTWILMIFIIGLSLVISGLLSHSGQSFYANRQVQMGIGVLVIGIIISKILRNFY